MFLSIICSYISNFNLNNLMHIQEGEKIKNAALTLDNLFVNGS